MASVQGPGLRPTVAFTVELQRHRHGFPDQVSRTSTVFPSNLEVTATLRQQV
jgi:hypothetical protein